MRSTKKLDLAALISFITLFLKDTNICLSVNELDLRECFKALSLSFINLLMSLEIQGRVYLLFPLDLLFLRNRFVMFWIVDMRTFVSLSTFYTSYDLVPVNIFDFPVARFGVRF